MTDNKIVVTKESDVKYSVSSTTEHRTVTTEESISHVIKTEQEKTHRITTAAKQGPPGPTGKDAYQIALDNGFVGTKQEWLLSLNGKSAYQIALDNGFVGTEAEWLENVTGIDIAASDAYKFLSNDGVNAFWVALTKQIVGLGNVDNTSDMDKPVSNAQQAALNLKLDKDQFRPQLETEINNNTDILIADLGEL